MLDLNKIRADFPILNRKMNGRRLVYLDNAATSQKPKSVIECMSDYYQRYNANIHRGIHTLSEEATAAFENVREKTRALIDAPSTHEIIFTRNTTESINLVAYTWGRQNILPGDEILLTAMEHHSNLIPWQQLAKEREAKLVFIELTESGELDMSNISHLIGARTKLVAITQMSSVLGTIPPIAKISKLAHAQGAVVLVDGAQGAPHLTTSVQELECDFYAFSFHKMLGPTGVGILWAKTALLETMPPFMFGGNMISSVWRDRATWAELPWKFEAGTPDIASVIGTNAAIEYINQLGIEQIRKHEVELTEYALQQLSKLEDVTMYGPPDCAKRGGVISFNLKDVHPHDVGQILNDAGIAIRAGHHCCQPLMRDLNVTGTARASLYVYNTKEDIDLLLESLTEADKVLGHVACR